MKLPFKAIATICRVLLSLGSLSDDLDAGLGCLELEPKLAEGATGRTGKQQCSRNLVQVAAPKCYSMDPSHEAERGLRIPALTTGVCRGCAIDVFFKL